MRYTKSLYGGYNDDVKDAIIYIELNALLFAKSKSTINIRTYNIEIINSKITKKTTNSTKFLPI